MRRTDLWDLSTLFFKNVGGKKRVVECFDTVTFCTCQTQRNDRRNCSTFLSLIESWEDKQVSRCSPARAWERAERELERERKRQVSGFACVSAYLTNDRKIKASPVSWRQEWRAQRREEKKKGGEGEGNLIPSYTRCRRRAVMEWWQNQNERKTKSVISWF